MYDIYVKPINDAFAGRGAEHLIVEIETGIVLAHVRGWDDPTVVLEGWEGYLRGKHITECGRCWTPLGRDERFDAQAWALDILEGD